MTQYLVMVSSINETSGGIWLWYNILLYIMLKWGI